MINSKRQKNKNLNTAKPTADVNIELNSDETLKVDKESENNL